VFGLVSVTGDGHTIVYSTANLQARTRTVVARNQQTGQETILSSSLSPSGMVVSPDGQRIAIWSVKPGGRTAIQVMSASGGEPREVYGLERPAVISGGPAWTPDGRYLLFPARPKDKTVLMAVPSEGGESRSFAFATDGVEEASVHPDGARVAFAAGQARSEVWVIENFLPKK
jgi:Tol biopolymer transport system component